MRGQVGKTADRPLVLNSTPQSIRDWLDLIYQSIPNPERAVINRNNKGIRRAADPISFENLTPEERALSKNKESAKITIARTETAKLLEVARNLLELGLSAEVVAESTTLTIEQVRQVVEQLHL